MKQDRQKYIDSNFAAAREAGCDTLQLKLDGWWSRHEYKVIENEPSAQIITRTGRNLDFAYNTPHPTIATIIGELMYGTNWAQQPQLVGKVYAFDCWAADGIDLDDAPYRDRYNILRAILKRLPANFIRVENFPISDFDKIWNGFVVNGDFEGVVFRNSKDDVHKPIYRQKNVVVDIYQCVGFVEGEGKFDGTLGALKCRSPQGIECTVGGGFDNMERDAIWKMQDQFVGKYFEVEGRKRFAETGLLRHPNFVKWKD